MGPRRHRRKPCGEELYGDSPAERPQLAALTIGRDCDNLAAEIEFEKKDRRW